MTIITWHHLFFGHCVNQSVIVLNLRIFLRELYAPSEKYLGPKESLPNPHTSKKVVRSYYCLIRWRGGNYTGNYRAWSATESRYDTEHAIMLYDLGRVLQWESKQALSISLCLSRPILPSREILDCDILLLLSNVAPIHTQPQWQLRLPQWQLILIKNLLSLVPKADIKIVQLDLLGVAMVFFFFISYLQICFFLSLYIGIDQLASMLK